MNGVVTTVAKSVGDERRKCIVDEKSHRPLMQSPLGLTSGDGPEWQLSFSDGDLHVAKVRRERERVVRRRVGGSARGAALHACIGRCIDGRDIKCVTRQSGECGRQSIVGRSIGARVVHRCICHDSSIRHAQDTDLENQLVTAKGSRERGGNGGGRADGRRLVDHAIGSGKTVLGLAAIAGKREGLRLVAAGWNGGCDCKAGCKSPARNCSLARPTNPGSGRKQSAMSRCTRVGWSH